MSIFRTESRPIIYQLLVRTFGNTNPTRKAGGTIEENGCGKFSDINEAALKSIVKMGFTHVWTTGVIEQASGTSYPDRAADPADILKGKAGSPYAIRDYFDVCPDYADVPEARLEEFRAMVERCHAHGLKVIIDFIPNHVARSYQSDVRPDLSFGEQDDKGVFFDRENHFYYLGDNDAGGGAPLKLPTADLQGCTGLFEPESEFGRVTGNNSITWAPTIHDWYETVKLNYGHDYTQGRTTGHLPGADAAVNEVPHTWRTMDEILGYWQEFGVDGFRVDMAHMVPMEFWRWSVKRARGRNSDVFFAAEAYDSDPAKLTDADVIEELWKSGFDGAYEHPTYKILQGIYEEGKWANDLDAETFCGERFHHCVRYLENHDEIRIANPNHWGGAGMNAGRPAAAVMFGMSGAAVMVYSGQEIGEPAMGAEGFSGDDGRSSIFDYTCLPELQKWVNGGAYDGKLLSKEQTALRKWYKKLLKVIKEPAFERGGFFGLNFANGGNPRFGRVGDETCSGHWLYAFLRFDEESGQGFLCVANFHATETLVDVRVIIPVEGFNFLKRKLKGKISFKARLQVREKVSGTVADVLEDGLAIGDLEPFGVRYYELK
ncbi:MAG: alpha-amylase family glycosyl hydrolase [Luteolibacter sp.]